MLQLGLFAVVSVSDGGLKVQVCPKLTVWDGKDDSQLEYQFVGNPLRKDIRAGDKIAVAIDQNSRPFVLAGQDRR